VTGALRGLALSLAVAVGAMLAVGGGACHEGNGLQLGDLTPPPDLLTVDLLPPVDMVPPPNCGKIVFCALGCLGGGLGGIGGGGTGGGGGLGGGSGDGGANPLGCVLGCGQNAPPDQVTAALGLVICAATNCLAGDGGTSGQLGVFQCIADKCPMQLAACPGLGIGG